MIYSGKRARCNRDGASNDGRKCAVAKFPFHDGRRVIRLDKLCALSLGLPGI